jgi:uncharacterized Fe-S cluster-containing radical SAM superfamily protein
MVNDASLLFVLETNGILIGYDESIARELAKRYVYVRVSIKAPKPETFSKVTGAKPEAFELQIKALENLVKAGLRPPWIRAAVVMGYGSEEDYARLIERLAKIHPALADIEPEVLTLYPSIKRRLTRLGLVPRVYWEA